MSTSLRVALILTVLMPPVILSSTAAVCRVVQGPLEAQMSVRQDNSGDIPGMAIVCGALIWVVGFAAMIRCVYWATRISVEYINAAEAKVEERRWRQPNRRPRPPQGSKE